MAKEILYDRDEEVPDCIYNDGVFCAEHHCYNCGWNPWIDERRKMQWEKAQETEKNES